MGVRLLRYRHKPARCIAIPLIMMSTVHVFANTSDEFQVFRTIIVFYAIEMMDDLGGVKISPKLLFHLQTVLANFFAHVAIWMVRSINLNITVRIFTATAPPFWIV